MISRKREIIWRTRGNINMAERFYKYKLHLALLVLLIFNYVSASCFIAAYAKENSNYIYERMSSTFVALHFVFFIFAMINKFMALSYLSKLGERKK